MVTDSGKLQTQWTLRKYADDAAFERGDSYDVVQFAPNLLLEEGITELLNLLVGAAATAFSNANAHIGVGDSATAESAAHTGLQAAVNKAYVAMEATYPQISAQTITFRSVFDGSTANFAWNEFTVANGVDDAAVNLNRKVSAQGTKTAGQIWTVDVDITFS